MNILSRLSIALIISLGVSGAARPVAADILRDDTIGMTLAVPKGWFVAGAKDALDPDKVEFGSDRIQRAVRNYKGPMPQSLTKYKEPYPDLNPNVQIQPFPKPAGVADEASFLTAVLVGMKTNLNQASIVKPVSLVRLGGRRAANCALEHAITYQGKVFRVRSELWAVEVAGRMLVINASARQDEANGKMSELRSIVGRISFAGAR